MDAAGDTTATRMPALFIGHGSPMNMVLSNAFTASLAELGRTLPRPKAIMVVSAHWLTRGTLVGCMDRPRTIHDFYGFPEELYRVRYDCDGAPAIARQVTALTGGSVRCDDRWGLDHASYSVLRHMYPAAEIPVFEMSLDYAFNDLRPMPVVHHYGLAKRLRPLRGNGVLVVGSGNMVHDLRLADPVMDAPPADWAVEADAALREYLLAGDHQSLVDYPSNGDHGRLAAPSLDHYLPMVYVLALQEEGERLRFTYEGFQNGTISMRGFRVG